MQNTTPLHISAVSKREKSHIWEEKHKAKDETQI